MSDGAEEDEPALDVQLRWPNGEDPASLNVDSTAKGATGGRRADVTGSVGQTPAAPPPLRGEPMFPTIIGHVEAIDASLAALSVRIESLGAATTGLRSLLSDRLADHADLMSTLARSQVETIDEYRHGNERALTDVRRLVSASEDSVRDLAGRIEELLLEASGSSDRLSREVAAGFKGVASELSARILELNRGMTTAVDLLADEIRATRFASATSDAEREFVMPEIDAAELAAAVTSEIGSVMRSLARQLDRVENALVHPPDRAGQPSGDGDVAAELTMLRDEVQQLKRRIGLRARAAVTLKDDQLDAIAEALDAKVGGHGLSDEDLGRIVDAIGERLLAMIEVVPATDEAPKAAPRKRTAAPAPKRRGTS